MSHFLECLFYCLRWDATAMVFAIALWPAFDKLFPRRIAWAAARLLSPAAIAYLALLPGLVRRPTPFDATIIATCTAALGLLTWLVWGKSALANMREEETFWREIFAFEKALLAFLFLACLYVPFIASMVPMGERLRDTGILNAVLTQKVFPVEEPWFAGVRIQYYTFGYYVPSAIALFVGRDTLFVYNLIIAWTFACYGAAGWMLFRALRCGWLASFFGASALALGSSLACLCQALKVIFASGIYDWWWVSRVIENTIDEFPLWTSTLGDLHPHYLAMPLFPCLLAWLAGWWLDDEHPDSRGAWRLGLVSAAIVAWIWGANTWELPVCLAVTLGALWLGGWHLGWKKLALISVGTIAATVALSTIFLLTTPKANKTWAFVHHRSTALEILLHWGLFLLPVLAETARRLRGRLQSDWLIGIACTLGLALVLQSGMVLVALALALVAFAALKDREQGEKPSFHYLLALGGLGLVWLCEIVHLQDIFGDGMERLNTVFKFYVPAWAMLAAAAALCTLRLAKDLPKNWGALVLGLWALLLSGHLTVGLYGRTGGFPQMESMEGLDFWSRLAPDDARLMHWAREQVLEHRLSGTVLEASGGAYHEFGRVMTAAGLPGYFAWEGYGGMLQTLGNDPQIDHRQNTAKAIYKGTDLDNNCDRLTAKLAEEKIDWVVIGALERREAGNAAGLELMKRCLAATHQEGSALLLSARPANSGDSEALARGQSDKR